MTLTTANLVPEGHAAEATQNLYEKYTQANMNTQLVDAQGEKTTAYAKVRDELLVTSNATGVLAERMGQVRLLFLASFFFFFFCCP